jgi:predicted nucleic acid-binding protein
VIFIDSNIPMYLVGAPHPHKDVARRLLERFVAERTPLVTDVEVFQEILHRYVAIDRRDAIKPSFAALLELVDEVYSVQLSDAERARDLVLGKRKLSARDALHVAVMERNGINRILSFDVGFDSISSLTRIAE